MASLNTKNNLSGSLSPNNSTNAEIAPTIAINGGAMVQNLGADGATFIPNVDDEGNISWTNDQDRPNPETKNIKGPAGTTDYNELINTPTIPSKVTDLDDAEEYCTKAEIPSKVSDLEDAKDYYTAEEVKELME
jgi:hypothetical protein